MPCSNISLPAPTGPSGPLLSGFGLGATFPVIPNLPLPAGIPEDLLYILDLLKFLIPPGKLIPALNPNFAKDIFDAIMDLLKQFMPFLMLYKFIMPILNLIICIIEVLCAIPNPFALIAALERLFTQCLPPFLNLFPIFALILMIISLLLLMLKLIEYIIQQILLFILALLRNINALVTAFMYANVTSVLAIAQKLGFLMCIFQNLLVLLAFMAIIIQAFKDLLSLITAIPPCSGGDGSSCCSPQFCPAIVQGNFTYSTGTLQYLSEAGIETSVLLTPPDGYMTSDIRPESWQIYDSTNQTSPPQFINIINAPDVAAMFAADGYTTADGYVIPTFFPTTMTFNATTPAAQAAYTVDIELTYNPGQWQSSGQSQRLTFKDCVVLLAPTTTLIGSDPTATGTTVPSGVLSIAGGTGYITDGMAPLMIDDVNNPGNQIPATLNNYLHVTPLYTTSATPSSLPSPITISDVTYTFKPVMPTLMTANLVTLGCQPSLALKKAFVNNVAFGNIGTQTNDLRNLVNSPSFPDPAAAQACLLNSIADLRANLTVQGAADFQTSANVCLAKLQADTEAALAAVIGIGCSPAESTFSLDTNIQFTTAPIVVSVNLNENSGMPITGTLPASVGAEVAPQIVAYPTFGEITPFEYDGYQAFTAHLTSADPGEGQIQVAFNNQFFCTNTMPANADPTHVLKTLDYQFIYVPTISSTTVSNVPTGEGDTSGVPRREGRGE